MTALAIAKRGYGNPHGPLSRHCVTLPHVTVSTYLVKSELQFTRVNGNQCQGHQTLSGWANDSSDPGADCDLPQEIAPWNLPLCDLVISEMLGEDLGRSQMRRSETHLRM